MKDITRIRDLLYRSMDVQLSLEEKEELSQGLQAFPDLLVEREQLLQLRAALAGFETTPTPALFSEKVMEKHQSSQRIRIHGWATQIVAASICLLLFFMLGLYIGEGKLDLLTILGVDQLSPEEAYTLLNY